MGFNSYNKQQWSDSPALTAALQSSRFNVAEQGIQDQSDRLDLLYWGVYRPEQYAASPFLCGNGVTDDTAAFAAMAAAINALGQGAHVLVTFRPGAVYRVGSQTAGGNPANTPYYVEASIFAVQNIASCVVAGNGATIKYNDGLHIGTFNTTDGSIFGSSTSAIQAGATNAKYLAQPGNILTFTAIGRVTVRDLEIQGNDASFVRGGAYGNVGTTDYSAAASGIFCFDCPTLTTDNVYAHHCPLDGLTYTDTGTQMSYAGHSMRTIGCNYSYNGRNNVSDQGHANSYYAASCFNFAGRGAFTTAPAVGIDFETYAPNYGRNGLVEACEFVNNASRSYSTQPGWQHLVFKRCVFWAGGNTFSGQFATPSSPGVVHEDCEIYGFINSGGSDTSDPDTALKPLTGLRFLRCTIEDADYNQPVDLLDHAGYPTLRLAAIQRYGTSTAPTTITVTNGTGSNGTNINRWRLQVYYNNNPVPVEDFNNLNTVAGGVAALSASAYVIATTLGSPSANPAVDPVDVTNLTLPVYVLPRTLTGLVASAFPNSMFSECTFIAHSTKAFSIGINATAPPNAVIRNCTVVVYNSTVADRSTQSFLRYFTVDGLKFVEPPSLTPPTTGWYVATDSTVTLGPGGVTVGPSIHWSAFNGRTGLIRNPQNPQFWGPFVPSVAYSQGDVVTNGGHLYSSNTNFTATSSFNAPDWTQLV